MAYYISLTKIYKKPVAQSNKEVSSILAIPKFFNFPDNRYRNHVIPESVILRFHRWHGLPVHDRSRALPMALERREPLRPVR